MDPITTAQLLEIREALGRIEAALNYTTVSAADQGGRIASLEKARNWGLGALAVLGIMVEKTPLSHFAALLK